MGSTNDAFATRAGGQYEGAAGPRDPRGRRAAWAKAGLHQVSAGRAQVPAGRAPGTIDRSGSRVGDGDGVSVTEDLDVEGAGFTARRGTIAKGIRWTDDPASIEGRINGTLIVLRTRFFKRQSG